MAGNDAFQVQKPRSMIAGARNVLRTNDSASLWNCTLSPGWSQDESETLRKALMKFGIGNWSKIIESGCLPGKTNAQMNLQLQRLLGQQSTAEFAGLHIDPKVIGEKNSKIQGPHIKRKNNCIVNTGGKLSREELRERMQRNKEMYELPEEEWNSIELPKVEDPVLMLEAKREELRRLQKELAKVQGKIEQMRTIQPARMDKLKSTVDNETQVAEAAAQ
ncbi:protein [Lichtheimia corymbifera JMRC:FSU:9682]|uniref:Protein n=1 Tax=Lichtheimia corymbifera JMRC:FSU:9682 TaxID=1263082 RepID=A0A068SES7_9FUNG|nr:protein [Lichtheimia corymbifera JMRC:FSU:9682]